MDRLVILELGISTALFAGYAALWTFKRRRDKRRTGVDPEVLGLSDNPVQAYFARLVSLMTPAVLAVIGMHAFAPQTWPPLVRVPALDSWRVDLVGGASGIVGLGLCALAQATMGPSWRVGIDTKRPTDLVTSGVFRMIRNPTYLGLHLVNLGLWLVWPTTIIAAYAVLFFVVMDIQVRSEEEHLIANHGEAYRKYVNKTWRYLPWLY